MGQSPGLESFWWAGCLQTHLTGGLLVQNALSGGQEEELDISSLPWECPPSHWLCPSLVKETTVVLLGIHGCSRVQENSAPICPLAACLDLVLLEGGWHREGRSPQGPLTHLSWPLLAPHPLPTIRNGSLHKTEVCLFTR